MALSDRFKDSNPRLRCAGCQAPIRYSPGAGSRLCPFCGFVNPVREQSIAAGSVELQIDEILRWSQLGQPERALKQAEQLKGQVDNSRLALYAASIQLQLNRLEDCVFSLIDLAGSDSSEVFRADVQAKLTEALLRGARLDEAVQAGQTSLQLCPGHPAGRYWLAQAFTAKGQHAQAIELLEMARRDIDQAPGVTFPPPDEAILLGLAINLLTVEEHARARDVVLELLIDFPCPPVGQVARAGKHLGLSLSHIGDCRSRAVEVLRRAAMVDPDNRHGVLSSLRLVCEEAGGDFRAELQHFKQKREEDLRIIWIGMCESLPGCEQSMPVADPDLDLTLVHSDPDLRVDFLEKLAHRFGLTWFDRGTLFPLRHVEDFRRWVSAWRLRTYVKLLQQDQQNEQRLKQLKRVHQSGEFPMAAPIIRREAARRGRSRWLLPLAVFGVVLVLAGVLVAALGGRFWLQFEGRLQRVECERPGARPPCQLIVKSGAEDVRQIEQTLHGNWFERWWGAWLYAGYTADGSLAYPLRVLGVDIEAESYLLCVGQPIVKSRLSFVPECRTGAQESPHRP